MINSWRGLIHNMVFELLKLEFLVGSSPREKLVLSRASITGDESIFYIALTHEWKCQRQGNNLIHIILT